MKTKLKKHALEGTCNGDVIGGLSWAGESFSAFLFLKLGKEFLENLITEESRNKSV